MRKFICTAVTVVFLATLLHGCAENGQVVRDHPNTMIGIGAGVLGGAVVGGIIGGGRGAVIGGLLGGLAGGVIGSHIDHQEKSRAQTNSDYAYTSSQGTRLKVETVRANPGVLSPGETVNINLTYAVLTPSVDQQVMIRESREIMVDGTSVGRTSINIAREGGTWKSTVPITLPSDAPRGDYRVLASIEGPGGDRHYSETSFKVRQ